MKYTEEYRIEGDNIVGYIIIHGKEEPPCANIYIYPAQYIPLNRS